MKREIDYIRIAYLIEATKKTGDFVAYRQLKQLLEKAGQGDFDSMHRINLISNTLERIEND
jgi:hypothetical protein